MAHLPQANISYQPVCINNLSSFEISIIGLFSNCSLMHLPGYAKVGRTIELLYNFIVIWILRYNMLVYVTSHSAIQNSLL